MTLSTHDSQNSEVNNNDTGVDAVTGAFSYSGSAIAQHLLSAQRSVRTLTSRSRPTGDSPIDVYPLDFDNHIELERSLQGVTTLYNTYWVRFARGTVDHSLAIENSRALFQAARRAGVQRIVHVSITHPNSESPLPYFRGKALVERALAESGVSYAILRPAILFGGEGVLINNIAWLLRTLPVFAVGGRGDYRIRGIHIDDLAELALRRGAERTNSVSDAVGPEQPTFLELVNMIKSAVNSRSVIFHVPGWSVPPLSRVVGAFLGDVLLTRDEFAAMENGLADSDAPATGTIQISQWIRDNADSIGCSYANELSRHYKQ